VTGGKIAPPRPSTIPHPSPRHDEIRGSQAPPGPGNDDTTSGRADRDRADAHQPKSATGSQADRLSAAHAAFRKWLGSDYDMGVLNAVLAAAASNKLDGDPVWLLVIGGSGNAKTETVSSLRGAGAYVTSTIASEGALLSATASKERSNTATGGLLRSLGKRSVLVLKDFTTILSMSDRNSRSAVLAALREIYDGYWQRNVGSDGGQSLEWKGTITLIGACTTAWDSAHAVVALMGERFVLVRSDARNSEARLKAGRQAIMNTGHETEMREELEASVKLVLRGINKTVEFSLSGDEEELILRAANLVTFARTAVEYDHRGKLTYVHAPEAPTRFAKELTQLARGALAIGLDRHSAIKLALRCAKDSMPPLRLACLLDIAHHGQSSIQEVRQRIQQPWSAVERHLQALHGLGLLTMNDPPTTKRINTTTGFYSLADGIDRETLLQMGG